MSAMTAHLDGFGPSGMIKGGPVMPPTPSAPMLDNSKWTVWAGGSVRPSAGPGVLKVATTWMAMVAGGTSNEAASQGGPWAPPLSNRPVMGHSD